MRDRELVDALEYLEESCDSLSENYDNESAIEVVEELKDLGCTVYAEIEEDERFTDALFVTLPKNITIDLLVYIASLRPDEVSEENPGQLRLWWD